ncbi:MAG: glycosyltransferase [Bacteroidetes bacterium]|nr:glycosyltransferase [Bacteroidota bacterium]
MEKILLSYVMTTYNKLSYLKVTLPFLIKNKKKDEEIVITDGGSTDGTAEYLSELYKEGHIDQFISEKDFGEAHGTNKAILMAKGEIVKVITDDDIFHYPTITTCKQFMLDNTHIDILGFDGFGFNINHSTYSYLKIEYVKGFKKWLIDKTPFLFCGLGFMLRKTSLEHLGLFNTNFKIVDFEYSIRVSSMNAKIAFYTGMGFINIVNPQSNSHKFYEIIDRERKMLAKIYPSFRKSISYKGSILKLKEIVARSILKRSVSDTSEFDYLDIASESIKKLDDYNSTNKFVFLS